MADQIFVTKGDLPELRRLYKQAVSEGATEFTFKEHTVLVDYAKYLIEYLETFKLRNY